MLSLEDIINGAESREIKRALAVKMVIFGFKVKDICSVLEVSDSFVSKWKVIYESKGAEGLRLHYKGGPKFLTDSQQREIFSYLKDRPCYSLEELMDLLKQRYGVVYRSKQSYYDLLKEAGLSWYRAQATGQKNETSRTLLKHERIKKNWRPTVPRPQKVV